MKKTPKIENKTNKSTKYILSLIGGADPQKREQILEEIKRFLIDNAQKIQYIKLNLVELHSKGKQDKQDKEKNDN
jgi:hypothetical protein